jgi:hypothetical protein
MPPGSIHWRCVLRARKLLIYPSELVAWSFADPESSHLDAAVMAVAVE